MVNKPPVKETINFSQYFVLLPLGWEPLHPSLEYSTFETCAWKPAYLSSVASSHLEYLTVCAYWIPNYFLPSSGTLKCVCEHLVLLYFISRISAITRNTQVCVNILYCGILYQGFQIFSWGRFVTLGCVSQPLSCVKFVVNCPITTKAFHNPCRALKSLRRCR